MELKNQRALEDVVRALKTATMGGADPVELGRVIVDNRGIQAIVDLHDDIVDLHSAAVSAREAGCMDEKTEAVLVVAMRELYAALLSLRPHM